MQLTFSIDVDIKKVIWDARWYLVAFLVLFIGQGWVFYQRFYFPGLTSGGEPIYPILITLIETMRYVSGEMLGILIVQAIRKKKWRLFALWIFIFSMSFGVFYRWMLVYPSPMDFDAWLRAAGIMVSLIVGATIIVSVGRGVKWMRSSRY